MKQLLLLLLLLLPLPSHAARLFVRSNSDSILVPNPVGFRWSSGISMSVWVRPASLPASGNQFAIITDVTSDGTLYAYLGYFENSGGQQQIRFYYQQQAGVDIMYRTSSSVSSGSWSHIAWTFDRSASPDVMKIYINGTSQSITQVLGGSDNSGPGSTVGGVQRIGSFTNPIAGTFDGDVAYPTVWFETVLNQQQITALARGAVPNHVLIAPNLFFSLDGVFSPETGLYTSGLHQNSTTITGTSRSNGPPTLPR